ncbi:MAG: hypothetical protein WC340_16830 [Kiritimatiellia bacterium]
MSRLTTEQLAAAADVSTSVIHRMASGIGDAKKVGGKWDFPPAAIAEVASREIRTGGRKPGGPPKTTITIELPPELKNAIVKAGARRNMKMAAWIREACKKSLPLDLMNRL